MPRINLDERFFTDLRFKKLADTCQETLYSVRGRILTVWHHCYEHQAYHLPSQDIDLLADFTGFAEAMVGAGLAECEAETDRYRIRGLRGRIEYLKKLRANAALGGQASGQARRKQKRSKWFNGCSTDGSEKSNPLTLNTSPNIDNKYTFKDFEQLYNEYLRKEGKTPGIKICLREIKSCEDYRGLKSAIQRYAFHVGQERVEKKYVKLFSTFMGQWRDWLNPF